MKAEMLEMRLAVTKVETLVAMTAAPTAPTKEPKKDPTKGFAKVAQLECSTVMLLERC